jgi:hypothetical protein
MRHAEAIPMRSEKILRVKRRDQESDPDLVDGRSEPFRVFGVRVHSVPCAQRTSDASLTPCSRYKIAMQ